MHNKPVSHSTFRTPPSTTPYRTEWVEWTVGPEFSGKGRAALARTLGVSDAVLEKLGVPASFQLGQTLRFRWGVHQVQQGDTLFSLAKTYGTTVEAITLANGLTGSALRQEQVLKVPGEAGIPMDVRNQLRASPGAGAGQPLPPGTTSGDGAAGPAGSGARATNDVWTDGEVIVTLDLPGRETEVAPPGWTPMSSGVTPAMESLMNQRLESELGDWRPETTPSNPNSLVATQALGQLSREGTNVDYETLQFTLDLIGVVDPTGTVDAANALLSAGRGKWGDAAISLAGLLPVVGDAAKVKRIVAFLVKKHPHVYAWLLKQDSIIGGLCQLGQRLGLGSGLLQGNVFKNLADALGALPAKLKGLDQELAEGAAGQIRIVAVRPIQRILTAPLSPTPLVRDGFQLTHFASGVTSFQGAPSMVWEITDIRKAGPGGNLRQFLGGLEQEARNAGAEQLVIRGMAIVNDGFLNRVLWERAGFQVLKSTDEGRGILVVKKL